MGARRAAQTVAVDLGGTHQRVALVSETGDITEHLVEPTPVADAAPHRLVAMVREVARRADAPSSVVLGLAGEVDYAHGRLLWSPNLPASWPSALSEELLASEVGLPVRLVNDADLAAIGEASFGAGKGISEVAYVTISTGIGAGVMSGGRLARSHRSIAQLGQTIADWRAWRDGVPATLEDVASGAGLARAAARSALGAISAEEVAARAREGDVTASRLLGDAMEASASGIVSLCMMFAPDLVVLGGGLGLDDAFREGIEAALAAYGGEYAQGISIVPAALGDSAGLAGAARASAAFA